MEIITVSLFSFFFGVFSTTLYLDWKKQKEEEKLHDDIAREFEKLQGKINSI